MKFRQIRGWLVAGLLVWVPVLVTVFVVRILVDLMDKTLVLIPPAWQPDVLLGFHIPGLGLILALVVLLLTGVLLTNMIGRRLVRFYEGLVARIPLVGSVYSGAKKVSETLLSATGKSFRKVMLVEYPRKGIWSLGFLTSSELHEVQAKIGAPVLCVFVPTTPNPTTGFLVLVPADEVIELEMSVDEAVRIVISIGVVVPQWPRP